MTPTTELGTPATLCFEVIFLCLYVYIYIPQSFLLDNQLIVSWGCFYKIEILHIADAYETKDDFLKKIT